MSKVKRKDLEPLVIAEAKSIKKLALKRELKKLDYDYLIPNDKTACIYGQMTGDCYSERAYELITKSCPSVIEHKMSDGFKGSLVDFNDYANKNGVNKPKKNNNRFREVFFSPIEVFITRKRNKMNGNNAKLVAFLRGETDKLEFN